MPGRGRGGHHQRIMPVVDPESNQTQQQPAQEPEPVLAEKPEAVAKKPEPETVAKPAPVVKEEPAQVAAEPVK